MSHLYLNYVYLVKNKTYLVEVSTVSSDSQRKLKFLYKQAGTPGILCTVDLCNVGQQYLTNIDKRIFC